MPARLIPAADPPTPYLPPPQAGLLYRAIKMNVKLYRWERALDLAQQYKQHIETVLWYRRRYLLAAAGEETIARFKDLTEQVCTCNVGVCLPIPLVAFGIRPFSLTLD